MRSRWRAEVSNFGAFEILAKKLRVEDTGANQEIIRMNYEIFCVILTAALIILSLAISV